MIVSEMPDMTDFKPSILDDVHFAHSVDKEGGKLSTTGVGGLRGDLDCFVGDILGELANTTFAS